jgi:hypothetical protein
MTGVRRPTSGFMSEGLLRREHTLTEKHRQKERSGTSLPSARRGIKLLSDGATATSRALLAGARARNPTTCHKPRRRQR